MPPESEYIREINDDLFYENDRMLRSAPAGVNIMNFDPDLFTSRDLVLVPRITKTAPPLKYNTDECSSFFPEISWMVSNQNRRLADLMDFDKSESNISANSLDNSGTDQIDQLKDIFNNDIVEITKLIEVSKRLLDGRSDDKYGSSILTVNIRNKAGKSSEGHSSLPPIQKHESSPGARGFRARRSVREIADQVSRRIKVLKSDNVEFKILKEKIGKCFPFYSIEEYRRIKDKNRNIQSAPGRQENIEIYSPTLRLKLQSAWVFL